jgi:hypothetical protein
MKKYTWILVLLGLGVPCAMATPALAAENPGPGLELATEVLPTRLPPEGEGVIYVEPLDIGAADTHGTITVTDELPPGLIATDSGTKGNNGEGPSHEPELWDCSGTTTVTCRNDPTNLPYLSGGGGVPEPYIEQFPQREPRIAIAVKVETGTSGTLTNRVTAAGGGSPAPAATNEPITVSPAPAPFGLAQTDVWFSNIDGTIDTRAGSHPYAATFVVEFNQTGYFEKEGSGYSGEMHSAREVRDVQVKLPPGLVGDPQSVPQCPRELFENDQNYVGCPIDTQIGVATFRYATEGEPVVPVFNIAPPPGKPAEFGFVDVGNPAYLDSSVRTGGDDGITSEVPNAPQRNTQSSIITLWGDPGGRSHVPWYNAEASPECNSGECLAALHENGPLLTLPTSCTGKPQINFLARPWFEEASVAEDMVSLHESEDVPTGFTGCEDLTFEPASTVAPEKAEADAPTGLTAEVKPPLGGLLAHEGTGAAAIRDATVTLPQGMTINPGQAAGLTACAPSESAVGTEAAPTCPASSKVGTATIETPLLADHLEGGIFVLPSNPPEVKLLVAASADGVNVKLVGVAHLDPATGQVTTTFSETPQLPFSSFKLHFEGAPKAALVTPTTCGTYESHGVFNSWSEPFLPPFASQSSFAVSTGSGGGACPTKPLPFSPSLAAGTTNPVAGSSSSFDLSVSKPDDQQNLKTISATLPEGQLAKLAGVPLCPEVATADGSCPAASQVGTVSAAVGPGPNPLAVPQPGKAPTAVYLAGPYKGAPYSLVAKVPAQAGPFDLGTVVTRVALHVDETTTQVTATSDPLPQMLDGVPLEYQRIGVSIDRPDFIVNPTDCEPSKVSGQVGGSEGANADVANRYQVGECASLAFKPSLKLSLTGQTKRTGHPALKAVLIYPRGNNANIKRAQVNLPHSVFLDQGNLNKTCTKPVLVAGKCPPSTIYGKAKAYTPLLESPLEGPVYLVGGYGYKLPALVAELDGKLRVLLVGKVDSGKNKGIRNTFETVPDAPVSRFVLELKGGKKYSLLEVSEPLCAKPQKAIANFTGQNGKTYDTKPVIQVACGKGKGKKTAPKKK